MRPPNRCLSCTNRRTISYSIEGLSVIISHGITEINFVNIHGALKLASGATFGTELPTGVLRNVTAIV